MAEKVSSGELMTEEELKESRAQRDVLDFFLSPRGMELMGKYISQYIFPHPRSE